jgi:nitrile hydratase subunit beta
MSSVHDVGGKPGLGPIVSESDEPPFHAPWEGRMHGIAVTCQVSGLNMTAEQRATIETMSEAAYSGTTYYEKWLWAYEKLLDAKGIVTAAEMEQRIAEQGVEEIPTHPKEPANPSAYAAKVRSIILGGTPHDRPIDRAPKFKPGDAVRTKNLETTTHNRLPGYVKNKLGVVEVYFGAHCHPEAHAAGKGDVPEHLYAVRFAATELWGSDAESPSDAFYVDLFEDYLDFA